MIGILLLGLARRHNAAEEGAILSRIVQKDETALAELYDAYSRLVYSVALAIVKRRDEAEDLLQEIFMQVWEKAVSFEPAKGNVYAWLLTLARNRAIDRLKSKSFREHGGQIVEQNPDVLAAGSTGNPLDSLLAQERASLVKKILGEIVLEQREVIQLAYFGGHSQSEIARLLAVPLGTVKTRMRLGMRKLLELLKERL